MYLKDIGLEVEDQINYAQGPVEDSYDTRNNPSDSLICQKFLDQLSEYQFLKKEFCSVELVQIDTNNEIEIY